MTAIGSIYVSVRGDITQFQKDMTRLRADASKSGKEVSDALNNAIQPNTAIRGMNAINTGLAQLAQSAKAPGANFRATADAMSKAFSEVAQRIGMTEREFTALNEKMLRNQAMNQATKSMREIAVAAGLSKTEIRALALQMGYTSAEAKKMASNLDRSISGLKGATNTLLSMRSNLLSIGLAIAGPVYAIKSMSDAIWEAGRATKVTENAYKEITGSAANANKEFGFLRATADKLGLNFYTLREGYKGFLAAIQNSKIPMEEAREIFKSVSNAGAVLGLSNERMSLTFLALEQMISKGCHAKGTLIRMFDGSAKKVEDICVGDLLLGPDFKPRTVLVLARGNEEMFTVIPETGSPFTVNLNHIIQLHNNDTGEDESVILKDYLALPDNERSKYALINAEFGHVEIVSVEPIKEVFGEFYGFRISDDCLYFDNQLFLHHNTVSMEEIRRQLGDNIPGAFQIGAKAMGMTVEAFDKAVSAGEVFSDDFLPKFRKALDNQFKGGIDESVKAANKLAEAWEELKNKMASSGFMDSVVEGIRNLTDLMKDPSFASSMEGFAKSLGSIVWAGSKAAESVGWFVGEIKDFVDGIAALNKGGISWADFFGDEAVFEIALKHYKNIEKTAQESAKKIQDGVEVTKKEIQALIESTETEYRDKLGKTVANSPFKKDWEQRKAIIDEYDAKLKELKSRYDEASVIGDRLTNTIENQVMAMSEFISKYNYMDPAIRNLGLGEWEKRKVDIKKEADEVRKIIQKTDAAVLAEKEAFLKDYKKIEGNRADVIAQTEKEIAEIKERMAAPQKKLAEDLKKQEEDRTKRLADITDEFNKLNLSAERYEKLKLDEWYEKEKEALGGTNAVLEETVRLKLLLINANEKIYRHAGDDPELGIMSRYKDWYQQEQDIVEESERKKKELAEASAKAYEKAMKDQEDAFHDFSKTVQENTADLLMEMESGWEGFADTLVKMMKRTAAEMVAAFLSQKFIIPIAMQAGSALGMSWNGVPFANMPGGSATSPMGLLSTGNSLYNAFSGGASGMFNSGPIASIGSSLFGSGAWFGSGAALPSAGAFGGLNFAAATGGGNMLAAGGAMSSSGGIAGMLGAAAPWLGLAAVGIPLIASLFKKKKKDPYLGFSFYPSDSYLHDPEAAVNMSYSSLGFVTDNRGRDTGTNQLMKKSIESVVKGVDTALGIDFSQVFKSRADRGGGTSFNPATYGGDAEKTIAAMMNWVGGEMASDFASAYQMNLGRDFFNQIIPENSDQIMDAFVRFGKVFESIGNGSEEWARQVSILGDTLEGQTQAFENLEKISGVLSTVNLAVDSINQVVDPLQAFNTQFETYANTLNLANASLAQIVAWEEDRIELLGRQLTGFSAANVQNAVSASLMNNTNLDLSSVLKQSIISNFSGQLTQSIMPQLSSFSTRLATAFSTSGGTGQEFMSILTEMRNGEDFTAMFDQVNDARDVLREFFGDIVDGEDKLAEARKRAVDSIDQLINNLIGGSLAPVQSMEFFDRRYDQLLTDATGAMGTENYADRVSNLTSFIPSMLEFAMAYGGNYRGLYNQIMGDLGSLGGTNVPAYSGPTAEASMARSVVDSRIPMDHPELIHGPGHPTVSGTQAGSAGPASSGNINLNVTLKIGAHEFRNLVIETIKVDPEAQRQVRRVVNG